jgi:hypothetical protein
MGRADFGSHTKPLWENGWLVKVGEFGDMAKIRDEPPTPSHTFCATKSGDVNGVAILL